MQRRPFWLATSLTALCGLWQPARAADAQTPPRLQVVASFSILADLAEQVGGEAVQVHALVGRDADAHVFRPTPTDAKRLAQADLVVVNGLGFEGWLDRLVRASGFKGPVVVASAGVRTVPSRPHAHHGHSHGKDGAGADPHAWQDPTRVQRYVDNLRDAFSAARPALAAEFAARAAAYKAELQSLDTATRASLSRLPAERRRVLSSHDAFVYFADAYGVTFLAARSSTSGREPSAAEVARLIDEVRRQRAVAVFVENIQDARLVQRIADEAGARVGGRLYSDALSASGTEADSYLKLAAHNARTILAALNAL